MMTVEIRQLIKRYKDNLAVDQISLSIPEGAVFGLLGPNGAGKTTTIQAMVGLLRTDGGEIRIFGKELSSHEMEVKRFIGLVPQDIAVFEDLTAMENVTFFGKLYGLRGTELKAAVQEALDFTGLWDRRKEMPSKFSGGMKRRLNIACAIVHKPRLIIMDEPTVGIDPQSRNHILQSIRTLNARGATIVYTSHYMEEVEAICNDIAIMDHGRVIARGTPEELKQMIAGDDRVEIELARVLPAALERIRNIRDVREVSVDENKVSVISRKNARNLGGVIEAINESDVEVLSINVEKPTLEGVFLTLTGRKLRD